LLDGPELKRLDFVEVVGELELFHCLVLGAEVQRRFRHLPLPIRHRLHIPINRTQIAELLNINRRPIPIQRLPELMQIILLRRIDFLRRPTAELEVPNRLIHKLGDPSLLRVLVENLLALVPGLDSGPLGGRGAPIHLPVALGLEIGARVELVVAAEDRVGAEGEIGAKIVDGYGLGVVRGDLEVVEGGDELGLA
jgi:hypothetical protein